MLRDGGIRPLIEINPGADDRRDCGCRRGPVALRHPHLVRRASLRCVWRGSTLPGRRLA